MTNKRLNQDEKNIVKFTLRIPPDLDANIRRAADELNMSKQEYIISRLRPVNIKELSVSNDETFRDDLVTLVQHLPDSEITTARRFLEFLYQKVGEIFDSYKKSKVPTLPDVN